MTKTYSEFMKEISSDELYRGLLAFGMFSDKLPPIFTADTFFDCCQNSGVSLVKPQPHQLISYNNIRDTNVPRRLSVPNPFAYQQLCACIRDNWDKITQYFEDKTCDNRYKVSRIHIRKVAEKGALFTTDYDDLAEAEETFKSRLFDMNYKNWRTDGSPETDMMLGKRWLVSADISTCFPSIYTHSLSWALVGKDVAKAAKNDKKQWYNKIDAYTQSVKYGETNGIPIGPHASNLLSEIVLVAIDNELHNVQKWEYTRNVDDYSCYTESRESAERFLTALNKQLSKYNLSLNHKKTQILELPLAATAHWTRQMDISRFMNKGRIDYISVRSYLDTAVELMSTNGNKSSILKYAVKVLARRKELTDNAKMYVAKTMMNLCFIYPYLISLLDELIFVPFEISVSDIKRFSEVMLSEALASANYEAASYCVYFAIRYEFCIRQLSNLFRGKKEIDIVEYSDCVFLTMLLLRTINQAQQAAYSTDFAMKNFCTCAASR